MRALNTTEDKVRKAFRLLSRKTEDQREQFYATTVSWNINQIKSEIKRLEKGGIRYGRNIAHYEAQLDKKNLLTLQWLKDAEQEFDAKLNRVASKLVDFGFVTETSEMRIVDVQETHSRGLDFYVTAEDYTTSETEMQFGSFKREYFSLGRAYARLVWVECYEKQSHYRFICTKKKTL